MEAPHLPLRPTVTASIEHGIQVDKPMTAMDMCPLYHWIATCSGNACFLWNADSLECIHRFGRIEGGVHKKPLTVCQFSNNGRLLATAGHDKKVVVWSTAKKRSICALREHPGMVFDVRFDTTGEWLYTCSVDGIVRKWDWKQERLVEERFRHALPVRALCITSRLMTGRNDGCVSLWNTKTIQELGCIEGSSAITRMVTSLNGRTLVVCHLDGMCCVWDVLSYLRERVQVEEIEEEPRINIALEEGAGTMEERQWSGAEVSAGYHADLLFRLHHEAAVLDAAFGEDGQVLFTSSQDCTVRLWSAINGYLLYQINTPSPACGVGWSDGALRFCCEHQLVCVRFRFPSGTDALEETGHDLPELETTRYLGGQEDLPERVTVGEMQRIVAQGSLASALWVTVAQQYGTEQLEQAMRKTQVRPQHMLRMFHSGYSVKDVMTGVSRMLKTDQGEEMMHRIRDGQPVPWEEWGVQEGEIVTEDTVVWTKERERKEVEGILSIHSTWSPTRKTIKTKRKVKKTPHKAWSWWPPRGRTIGGMELKVESRPGQKRGRLLWKSLVMRTEQSAESRNAIVEPLQVTGHHIL